MDDRLIFAILLCAFLAAMVFERSLRQLRKRKWHSKKRSWNPQTSGVHGYGHKPVNSKPDATDQLRPVMEATFEKRRLLSKQEARVLYAAEKAIRDAKVNWRVMAQVSLGEVLSSKDASAFAAINCKRVDILIISSSGVPLAAIEFQGQGHYQGSAAARDAVKKRGAAQSGSSLHRSHR